MYRVRLIDEYGHVQSAVDIQCKTDDEAIDRAASFRHDHALQVWQGERLVSTFEDRHPPPRAPQARVSGDRGGRMLPLTYPRADLTKVRHGSEAVGPRRAAT